MRIMLCGGTGFIGTALAAALRSRGDEVWIVTRNKPAAPAAGFRYVTWAEWEETPARFEGLDAIVNLTGESINQRWTKAAKLRIVASRTQAAARIADIVRRMDIPPSVLVNASGISLYGHSGQSGVGEQPFDESSPVRPADFLGDTVVKWEAAADQVPVARIVKLRIGLVLARKGGAYPLLSLPHRLFVGGKMGSGRQGMPWIHLQDMVSLILFCLDHEPIEGPINAVGPEPLNNDEFGKILGSVIHRPHWFPVPAFPLRAVLGEMSCLVLTGQLAVPRKALDNGFEFRFKRLTDALQDIERT